MKILLSPSKTMTSAVMASKKQKPLFLKEAKALREKLLLFSDQEWMDTFQASLSIVEKTKQEYQTFQEQFLAIQSYTGPQFQALDYASLGEGAQDYINKHVYIMSGLYGFVRPLDTIGMYRLPMGVNLPNGSLVQEWKARLTEQLKKETLVIALASKEYLDALDFHNLNGVVIAFESKSGKTIPSYELKQLRGRFARHMAISQVKTLSQIKALEVGDYRFDKALSKPNMLVFKEKEESSRENH